MENAFKTLFAEFMREDTKFESIRRWRNNLKGGKYEKCCLRYLAEFCVAYQTTPDELVKRRLAELKSDDLTVRCHAEDMVMEYYKSLVKNTSGKAINVYRKIASFYRYNFLRLQSKDPGYTVQREQDYMATKDETRKMCELLDLEGKTYLLVLAESCGRSGAVAKLRWKDIQEELHSDKVPMKIWLKHKVKMARKAYFTFVCQDAKEPLQLLVEGRNLKPDDKVFSIHYSRLRKKVMDAAEKIGIYQNGNGNTQSFRLHTYRKRGQTILEKAGVPLNWVDRILGHVPRGAQGKTYSLPDEEAMREKYAQAMSKLQTYGTSQPTQVSGITREELKEILAKLMPQKAEAITSLLG
jgi:integrase